MSDKNSKELEQIKIIQNQISDALSEIDKIRTSQINLTNPEELEQTERLVVQATDKLAGLVTALKIQQAVASENLTEKSSELVKSMPNKLKSQGVRLVSVQTSRGEPVEIATKYYSRKKKAKRRKKNSCGPGGALPGIHVAWYFRSLQPADFVRSGPLVGDAQFVR